MKRVIAFLKRRWRLLLALTIFLATFGTLAAVWLGPLNRGNAGRD